MRKKFQRGTVSVALCLILVFTQINPQIISSAEAEDLDEGAGNDISYAASFDHISVEDADAAAAEDVDRAESSDASKEIKEAYEDSEQERLLQTAEDDQMLTAEESREVLDRVRENLGELSDLETAGAEEDPDAIRDVTAGAEGEEFGTDAAAEEDSGEKNEAGEGILDLQGTEEQIADVSWYTPEDTCFTLTAGEQLKGLALLVSVGDSFSGKTVALGNDIDMADVEWSLPIGNTQEHPFAGRFDGAGYTIENFHLGSDEKPASFMYTGFFGCLTGSVENLNLRGSIIACRSSGTLYAGGLAGYASSAEISCVTTDIQITAAGTDDIVYAGGLVGLSEDTVICDSETEGNLNIAGAKSNRTYAGGISGKAEDGGLVVNSGSTGEIEVSGETVFAGGLAGYLTGAENNCLKIHNDYHSGKVAVTSEAGYAGGLMGFAGAYTDVQNCCASGEVEGKKAASDDNDSGFALPVDGKEGEAGEEFDTGIIESEEDTGQADSSGSSDVSGGMGVILGLLAGSVYSDADSSVSFCYALAPGQSETGVTTSDTGMIGLAGEKGVILGNRLFKDDGAFEITESGVSPKTETVIMAQKTAELSCCETLYQALNLWVVHERSDEELSDGDESEAGYEVTAKYWSGSGIDLHPDSDRIPTMPQEPTVTVSPKEAFYRVGQMIDENDSSEADDGRADGSDSGAGEYSGNREETGSVGENNRDEETNSGAGENNSNEGETGGVDENNRDEETNSDASENDSNEEKEETGGEVNDGDEDNSGGTNDDEMNGAGEDESIPTKGPLTAKIAENPAESSQGTLFCQWYRCEDETGSRMEAIDGARGTSFAPPTDVSGVFYYRLHVICRTGERESYDIGFSSSWSEVVKVTVGYSVTYSSGVSQSDSISGSLPASGIYMAGSPVTAVNAGNLTYDGYYLRNWTLRYDIFDEEKGENVTKTVNISPGDSFVMPESDVTLTALWAPKISVTFEKCAADFELEDEIKGEIHADGFYTPGEPLTLPDQGTMQLEGYRFVGWYDAETGRTWQAGDVYEVPGYAAALYAVWSKAVTLRFTAEEGITGEAPADIETVIGASVTMPECTFDIPVCEESGYFYRFAGWKPLAQEPGGSGEPTDDDNTGEPGESSESDGTEKSEGAGADGAQAADNTEEAAPVYKAGSAYTVTGDAVFIASFTKVAVWNGSSVASSFDQGAGSAENPYIIETADQLAKLAQDVDGLNGVTPDSYEGVSFRLGADIDLNDMSWTPIGILTGSDSRPFAGYFDGAGHTVSHFKVDQTAVEKTDAFGLFGYVVNDDSSRPAIENLKIEEAEIQLSGGTNVSENIENGDIYIGTIVGLLKGSMSGCEAAGSVTVENEGGFSGDAGKEESGGDSFDGSAEESGDGSLGDSGTEDGNPSGSGSQSGAGTVTTGEPVYFSVFSGGLAGYVSDGTLTKCVSAVSVDTERKNPAEAVTVGGIAGCGSKAFFTECTNTGSVTLETGSAADCGQWTKGTLAVGGVAGQAFEGQIENCENTGNVSGIGSDILYVGGIVGYAQTAVADSINAGKIAADICYVHRSVSDSGKREEHAGWDAGIFLPPAYHGNAIGGITGYTHSDLLQCVNTGEVQLERKLSGSAADAVSAVSMAGGLAGGAVNGTISDSYNAGNIALTLTADSTSGNGTEGGSIPNADKCAGFAGGLVGISGFQAVDENAALDTDKGEKISYVHNFGQVSADAPNAAAASGKQAETSVGAGMLIGRCAYGTELNDAYGMEGALSIDGTVIGSSLSNGVLLDVGGSSSSSFSSGMGGSSSGGSLPGSDDGNTDKSIEDTGNVNEGVVGESMEEALIGDRNGTVQTSNVTTASKEQFAMGEIAYLLDGAKTARNVWTQSGGPYPVLGTPHLAKVTTQQPSEGGSVSFRLEGMSSSYETFYAAPGAKVVIVVVPPSEGMTVYSDWTTSVESDAGTTYYRYNSYYGYALFGLSVIFGNGESVRLLDVEFGIDEGRTFEMPKEGDASVSSYFDYGYDTIVVDTWFVPKEEEVPVDPEPEAPVVKDHTSTGGKEPLIEKDEEKGADPGSGDGPGGNHPNGNDEDRQPVLDPVMTLPNLTASDEPQNIQLPAESSVQLPTEVPEAVPENQPEPESDPEPAADPAPDRADVNEPEEAEQQEAPEEMTMFEVIQNTIKASPVLMLLMLLLLILLIAVGGYSRYRKNRRFK